jgi:hypothetical protein
MEEDILQYIKTKISWVHYPIKYIVMSAVPVHCNNSIISS